MLAQLLGACAGLAPAHDTADFVLPWHRTYLHPAPITKRYFPEPAVSIPTPAFSRNSGFTTHRELMTFIARLRERSTQLHLRELGKSARRQVIPMLVFARTSDGEPATLLASGRPTIWIHAQLHGDEPASGEGALALAWEMTGDLAWVLESLNVVIVPRVNPDGARKVSRDVANSFDPNRDAIRMMLAESRALRQANLAYQPVVTIDAHEFSPHRRSLRGFGEGGYLEAHDMLLLDGNNLNIAQPIRTLTDQLLIPAAMHALADSGMTSHRYYLVSKQNGEGRLRVSSGGPAARIGRNYHGLLNQCSILLESRGIGLGRTSFKRRVHSHWVAMRAIVLSVQENLSRVRATVDEARDQVVRRGAEPDDDDVLVVTAKPVSVDHVLPYIDLAEQARKLIPVQYFDWSRATPTLMRRRPFAYLIRADQQLAAETLRDIGLEVHSLAENHFVEVETFTIVQAKADGRIYQGAKRRQAIITRLRTHLVRLPKGSFIVYMAQPLANLAAQALEPEGADSFVTFGIVPAQAGTELPVYRLFKPFALQEPAHAFVPKKPQTPL